MIVWYVSDDDNGYDDDDNCASSNPGSKHDDYDDINCAAEGMDVFWIIIIISFNMYSCFDYYYYYLDCEKKQEVRVMLICMDIN